MRRVQELKSEISSLEESRRVEREELVELKESHSTLSTQLEEEKVKSSNNNKYSCKQRCGFLQRLRNQGKMYILHNFGKKRKKSGRRKEE